MPAEHVDPLHPKLQEAQSALAAALDEACETNVAGADDSELIRLEESLTVARDAARNAIGLLRRLHREGREEREEREDDTADSEAHRLFVDDRGVQWDAFPVRPSPPTSGRSSLPAPYNEGWLSMQCADEIRRVTPIPQGWRDMPRGELCRLLEKAAVGSRRTHRQGAKSNNPESRV